MEWMLSLNWIRPPFYRVLADNAGQNLNVRQIENPLVLQQLEPKELVPLRGSRNEDQIEDGHI